MESNKKRIRRDYAPLIVSAELVCTTPLSPVTQVYNSEINEYEPDRTLTPTIIHPDVIAKAKDGSWKTPQVNSLLANMVWKVNGVNITTLSEWEGKYSINTIGATRGDITIMRNISPETILELSFEAVVVDSRLGVNIPVKCEPVLLSTVDKSEDSFSLAIGDDSIIEYNPFKDKLHLYEYKVSHGIIQGSSSLLNEARDVNSYERTIPVQLYKGQNSVSSSAYEVRLYEITGVTSGGAQLTQLTTSTDEVIAIASTGITLDLRLVEKRDYLIRAYMDNKLVADKQFSVARVYPKYRISPTNETGISPSDIQRYDVAMVDCEGIVECPECIIRIIWKTDSATKTGVVHGEGGDLVFNLASTGIGDTYQDDWLDVYCEGEQKGVHSVAIDENSNELTNENGETLIFN